ncbi:MAG: hypothetical protein ACE5LC_06785 [Candidatus Aminicenantales bacterium]
MRLKNKKKQIILLALVLLVISSVLNYSLAFIFSPQTNQELFPIDWEKARQFDNLRDKYTFLSREYERITRLWEKMFKEEAKILFLNSNLNSYYSLLDDEIIRIKPLLFQEYASKNARIYLEILIPYERLIKLLHQWSKKYISLLNNEKCFRALKELSAAYIAWKAYENLVSSLDEVNLIFYEGFERGDLAAWKIGGEPGTVRIDSTRKVQGKYSLRFHTSQPGYVSQLLKNDIDFQQTKIRVELYVWLPSGKSYSELIFRICGIECFWQSQATQNTLVFRGEKTYRKYSLLPDRWHNINFFIDYVEKHYDVFINGSEIFKNIPFVLEREIPVHAIQIIGFYDEGNTAWLDDIRISYTR